MNNPDPLTDRYRPLRTSYSDTPVLVIDTDADPHEILDAAHQRMVWSHPGMTTYYRNSRGRVVTNSPYRVVDYWAMTHDADPADFDATPVRTREAA